MVGAVLAHEIFDNECMQNDRSYVCLSIHSPKHSGQYSKWNLSSNGSYGAFNKPPDNSSDASKPAP